MLVGSSVSLALGNDQLYFDDIDVEVAHRAGGHQLKTALLFDGLALWTRVGRGVNGSLNLDIRGGVHLVGDIEQFECADREVNGILDQAERERLFVAERVRLDGGAQGKRYVRELGDLSGAGDGLRIVVELNR